MDRAQESIVGHTSLGNNPVPLLRRSGLYLVRIHFTVRVRGIGDVNQPRSSPPLGAEYDILSTARMGQVSEYGCDQMVPEVKTVMNGPESV